MTRIASHRGGTLEFGDSTPHGFTATSKMALEEVEFDVHPTKDGAIVVHHDATLDATTDMSGAIAEMELADIKTATIRYGASSHPMTLEELCALYLDSHVSFRCEIKPGADGTPYGEFVPRVVSVLQEHGMLERTVFSSFLVHSMDEITAATDRPRLWLVSPSVLRQLGPETVIEVAKAHNIPEIGVHIDTADADLKALFASAGIEFGCWAAHTREQIGRALDLGVKVFTTDRPTLAIAIRESRCGGIAA
ncbi:glycerophosphodiester phosphodiesterase family protein [Rhizobium sp. RM]|uniref:glycerophosphodiester phosphodiesterase family protein n=1 Tax=Rhizobium sp. RM TaxID=2748079 RepID=UPI00110E349F|nr:glycerophosphodiester phosphodiesterase family protein [Rhizobium sp. RM]NWJ24007.1 glycerophosphodiester phosphodiesterase [Rhizobium sp. RM]TMV21418.1 glycerophosphodiester phosphodiesterase [Rhizobium sp. Td3]